MNSVYETPKTLLLNEMAMYNSIMSGMAPACHPASNNTATRIKVNLILLSVHEKFLNFKANNSIGATSRKETMMVIHIRTPGWETHVANGSGSNHSPVINRALAGVGNPIKVSLCLSSVLNLARRMAEKTMRKSGVNEKT
jgi:hypothetical protein